MNLRKVSADVDGPLILHFTVQMAPGRQVDGLAEEPMVVKVGERSVSVRREEGSLVFNVGDIASHEEGKQWVARIWHGLQFVAVRTGIAFKANFALQDVDIADGWQSNPGQLNNPFGAKIDTGRDGALETSRPYLAPVGATFWQFSAGAASVVSGTRLDSFLAALVEGASQDQTPEMPVQLETALQLFASAELEQQSARPRLLTYVMAIEALAYPRRPSTPLWWTYLRTSVPESNEPSRQLRSTKAQGRRWMH